MKFTDRAFRQYKGKLEGFMKKWTTPLGLNIWDIRVDYSAASEGETLGKCAVRWEYLQATITFYVAEMIFSDCDDKKLEDQA